MAYGYGFRATPPTNGMAIASLICGIVSLVGGFACFVGAIAAIPGLVLGIVAVRQIGQSNGAQQGKGLAVAGIVTSAVALLLIVALFALFAGSFLLFDPSS